MTTWIVEEVFAGDTLPQAAEAAGHRVVVWDDAWWDHMLPKPAGRVIFRGSLDNAHRLAESAPWSPGSYCATDAFRCSSWYPGAAAWLVQVDVRFTTVRALCGAPPADLGPAIFVRPDSPLKPFAGRVVSVDGLTPEALDHGFYYDDLDLPVVISRVRALGQEARFVVVSGQVVAGSRYLADNRAAETAAPAGTAWAAAQQIASALPAPEAVYVLDLVEVDGNWLVLELNPFSGADLYAADRAAVVAALGG